VTTRTISTYIGGGYVLAARYNALDITATGNLHGGTGLLINHAASVSNLGRVTGAYDEGANGVKATAAMSLTNGAGAYIAGYSGVFTPAPS
jgi:hypothetical protein